MCIVLPSKALSWNFWILTSNVFVFDPVSINELEFALNFGFARVVLIPPSPLNSNELSGILSSFFESLFASGS